MNTETKVITKENGKAGPVLTETDRKVLLDSLERTIREIEKDFSRIKYPKHVK